MRKMLALVAVPLAAAVLAGCGDAGDAPPPMPRPGGGIVLPSPMVTVRRAELDTAISRDLTGDGQTELIRLLAEGPRWDAAVVQLVVVAGRDSALLYSDRFNTRGFAARGGDGEGAGGAEEPEGEEPDTVLLRRIEERVRGVFREGAFERRAVNKEVVRLSLAEEAFRSMFGLKPGQPIPRRSRDQVRPENVSSWRVDAMTRSLENAPMFSYPTSLDDEVTIAWSAAEGRFVRIAR